MTEEQYCIAITFELVHELALFSHSYNIQDIHSSRLFFRCKNVNVRIHSEYVKEARQFCHFCIGHLGAGCTVRTLENGDLSRNGLVLRSIVLTDFSWHSTSVAPKFVGSLYKCMVAGCEPSEQCRVV